MNFLRVTLSALIILAAFNGCSYNTDPVNSIPVTNKGVFILNAGIDSTNPGDYTYISLEADTISNNRFQLANNGAVMGSTPTNIYRYIDHDLYITIQGNLNGGTGGKILHLDSRTDKIIDSVLLPVNPGQFVQNAARIYITNPIAGSLTKLDIDLNVLNGSIPCGPQPKDVIFANDRIYVSKSSSTSENSLGILNVLNDQVAKVFFPAPPVSVTNNLNKVFVSTYTYKKIYRMDIDLPETVVDSIPINISYDAIGDIAFGDINTVYVLALRNTGGRDFAKAVFRLDLVSRNVFPFIPESADIIDISGILYDYQYNQVFILDNKGGTSGGQLRIYDINGNSVKNFNLGNRYPVKMALRY